MQTQEKQTEHTRQRIVDAALEVFAKKGYHEATMDEIASVSQISKGGLYFHFPSKQDLFLALADAAANADRENGAGHADAKRGGKCSAIETAFQLLEQHRPLARLVFLKWAFGPPFDAKLMEITKNRAVQAQPSRRGPSNIAAADTGSLSCGWEPCRVLVWWLHQARPKPLTTFPELYIRSCKHRMMRKWKIRQERLAVTRRRFTDRRLSLGKRLAGPSR
jgi:AcrR family transcriptional regulator